MLASCGGGPKCQVNHPLHGDCRQRRLSFEQTGRIQWATDLAEIPQKFGVTNVYAELGTFFANSAVAHPKFCAALVGTLIKGMGVDHVMWGTDSVWYGSPQWQIEALRRLEIPEDMQKKYGFAPLGDANSATKQLIFGGNAIKFYKIRLKAADNTRMPAFSEDRLASLKNEYALAAKEPSNLRYGYVRCVNVQRRRRRSGQTSPARSTRGCGDKDIDRQIQFRLRNQTLRAISAFVTQSSHPPL